MEERERGILGVVKSCKRIATHSTCECLCDKVSRAAKDLMRTVPERARVTRCEQKEQVREVITRRRMHEQSKRERRK